MWKQQVHWVEGNWSKPSYGDHYDNTTLMGTKFGVDRIIILCANECDRLESATITIRLFKIFCSERMYPPAVNTVLELGGGWCRWTELIFS